MFKTVEVLKAWVSWWNRGSVLMCCGRELEIEMQQRNKLRPQFNRHGLTILFAPQGHNQLIHLSGSGLVVMVVVVVVQQQSNNDQHKLLQRDPYVVQCYTFFLIAF
jgi:hypothetical protein